MKPLISDALGLPPDARAATAQATCDARGRQASCPVP
jgi:hypothetical protein